MRAVARKVREKRECPRDWTLLRKERRRAFGRSAEVDECPTCFGIFLDKGEIRTLTGRSSLNDLLTKHLGVDSDSQLVCPNCGGLMDEEEAGDIRVDVCLKCNGVWLDVMELTRLSETDDAVFRAYTPEKIEEILKAKDIAEAERRAALRGLFRGLRRR